MSLPVCSRADLSRTGALVVALPVTAVSTRAVARESGAADTLSEDFPAGRAPRYMGRAIAETGGGRHQIRVFRSRQPGDRRHRTHSQAGVS